MGLTKQIKITNKSLKISKKLQMTFLTLYFSCLIEYFNSKYQQRKTNYITSCDDASKNIEKNIHFISPGKTGIFSA